MKNLIYTKITKPFYRCGYSKFVTWQELQNEVRTCDRGDEVIIDIADILGLMDDEPSDSQVKPSS